MDLQELRYAGVAGCDLRALVRLHYVDHALDLTRDHSQCRVFRPAKNLTFTVRCCFVLTEQGVSHARRILRKPRIADHSPDGSGARSRKRRSRRNRIPRWDASQHTLWLGDVVVKVFPHAALNQDLVLATFERHNWVRRLVDPLPLVAGMNPKRRLHDTIKPRDRSEAEEVAITHL